MSEAPAPVPIPAVQPPPSATPPLAIWGGRKIPIIGGTGKLASGKSIFGITISPNCLNFDVPADALAWDFEGSLETYEGSVNFERRDLAAKMLAIRPSGAKPIDLFNYWEADMRSVPLGKYRVGIADTFSPVEDGLADWVRANPQEFDHTAQQYRKMEGLFWGDMKTKLERLILEVAARFETFYFTVHLKNEWKGNHPTGKQIAKGKTPLSQLASLFIRFDRDVATGKAKAPRKPSGVILKTRLANFGDTPDDIFPMLPPRLPEATPNAIRAYIASPPDYNRLKKAEQLEEDRMSDDDRLLLNAQIASDEKEKAHADLSAMSAPGGGMSTMERMKLAAGQAKPSVAEQAEEPVVDAPEQAVETPEPIVEPATVPMVSIEAVEQIRQAMQKVFAGPTEAAAWMSEQGFGKTDKLTASQAKLVIQKLTGQVNAKLQTMGQQPMQPAAHFTAPEALESLSTEAANDDIPFDAAKPDPPARTTTQLLADPPANTKKVNYSDRVPSANSNGPSTNEQVVRILKFFVDLSVPPEGQAAIMKKRDVVDLKDLSFGEAAALIDALTMKEAEKCFDNFEKCE